MKRYLSFLILISICSLLNNSCCFDYDLTTEYNGCCNTGPVDFKEKVNDSTKVRIFIPNVFTPNEDGINDLFGPFGNDEIALFQTFKITSTKFNLIGIDNELFSAENLGPWDAKTKGWNGLDKFGNKYKGKFNYVIQALSKQGKVYEIKGSACSVICGPDAAPIGTNPNCIFGTQFQGEGWVEPIPSYEFDCFH